MRRVKAKQVTEPLDPSILEHLSLSERLAIGLDRLKRDRGLRAKVLAEQLGVTEAYMSQVMRGMRDVKLSTLDKMAREWNVRIEDLLTVTEIDLPQVAVLLARRQKIKKGDLPN
ncbi:helix-turn-helix domain-containing protein (plasmid) [Aliirhizobium terrae]|uniref:helix-turn-helix domain-containing protein n=1 Tax=Terrirhizobium terrae TaxID=2926709 RepID=UPI00257513ED|nr:helix-turn-helix transcriptional regulator [Rhizobium sp. CC-CFT758]WJH38557.1 helix-turn-helix domain-containing protein [Rhizobium sp. CC-CFT758]